MRIEHKLFEKIIYKLKNKQWYHQRFDGSPIFIFAISEAEARKENRKPKGTEGDVRVFFASKGTVDWYIEMNALNRGANKIIALTKKDKNISKKLLNSWKKDEQKYEQFFWNIFPKINLKKLSDNQLLDIWDKSYHLFINRATSSSIIDHFALGTDQLISDMLRKEVGSLKNESDFTNIFSTATAPIHQSFINQAEIDLLKIILKKSKQSLAEYQKKWFWSKNNYITSQILSVAYFKKEIALWKKSKKNLAEELKKLENTPRLNKLRKQKLFTKIKPSPLLRTLIKISEDFTWWQDERKKSTYFNTHIGNSILTEIAKRTGYDLMELKYALPSEIEHIIFKKLPTRKILQERSEGCAVLSDETHCEAITRKKDSYLKKIILGNKTSNDIQDFRGLSASTGRAVGKVKILKSATEVGKVNKGNILVAVMTRPDYISAMKKAAAIITNEGGITSHAAIVSRELGIPCIIGTKIATEVLKDGDMVEVDANKGTVKIIK